MIETLNGLKKWSDSRGITRQPPVIEDFIANIIEEQGEWLAGAKAKDSYEMIDAVADNAVFTITECFKLGAEPTQLADNLPTFSDFVDRFKNEEDSSRNLYNLAIIFVLGDRQSELELDLLLHISFQKMVTMGYDPEKVMDEVIKVLESRTGEWDNANGKFQKDTSPEAQAKWYTADYESCKL
jgi:hypothetical protein